MPLHKHRTVRAISAFSLTVILTIWFGVFAPEVKAEAVSGQTAQAALLQASKAETAARLQKLRAEAEEIRAARDALQNRLAGIDCKLPALERQVSAYEDELLRTQAEIRLLEAEMELLERQENASGAAEAMAALDGVFVWPMPGYDHITCDFGSGHRGIDIAGSGIYGKPITAADGGTVIYSAWMNSYGYCVFIDHGNGYVTRYAHASALACAAGDTVVPGQTVAYVGSTGNSTGPHLHFEILYHGVLQDPFDYFEN